MQSDEFNGSFATHDRKMCRSTLHGIFSMLHGPGYAKLEHAHKYVYTLTSSSTLNSMNIERKMSIVQKLLSRGSQDSVADTQNGECDPIDM
jgi:hypothetical protein